MESKSDLAYQKGSQIDLKTVLLIFAEDCDLFYPTRLNYGRSGKTIVDISNKQVSHGCMLSCQFGMGFMILVTNQLAFKDKTLLSHTLLDFAVNLTTPTLEEMKERGSCGIELSAKTRRGHSVTIGFDLSRDRDLVITSSSLTLSSKIF